MAEPETMRWEGDRLMLGDDELARINLVKPGIDAWIAKITMPVFRGASGSTSARDKAKATAQARAEIKRRIKQGRTALLARAREDLDLAERIAAAEFPKEG